MPSPVTTLALIVAAGRGVRAGGDVPKQYALLAGQPVLRRAVRAFTDHPRVDMTCVVIGPGDGEDYAAAVAGLDLAAPVVGGASRQDSVRLGLEANAGGSFRRVLIHDAARPLVTAGMIDRVLDALDGNAGATPALAVVDSLRSGGTHVEREVDRANLYRVQTPQGFRFDAILAAHRAAAPGASDDVGVARAAGLGVALVEGDEAAFKLTHPGDFARAEALLAAASRTVTAGGYDVHRFGPGDRLWLCGVEIAHSHGLVGHSDADVGLHALTDALLGCIGEGDIGQHFPPSDPQWRGASSDRFLRHAARLVAERSGVIEHVDLTIIAEAPKVGPHRAAMRARVAELLELAEDQVSIKATTTEGLGATGRREGIAAQALATLRLPRQPRP